MWNVECGIFLAPSYIILKNMSIPTGCGPRFTSLPFQGQEIRLCKFFSDLLVVTVIIIIIIIICAQVYPVYAPETLPPHHSWLWRLREYCLLCPSRLSDHSRGKYPVQRVAAIYSQVWWCYILVQGRSTSEPWLFLYMTDHRCTTMEAEITKSV